jgi:hypothetical protein
MVTLSWGEFERFFYSPEPARQVNRFRPKSDERLLAPHIIVGRSAFGVISDYNSAYII